MFLRYKFIETKVPYSVGQFRLHEEILDAYHLNGLAQSELKKKLKNISPLYPVLDFAGALVASGTAGGLIVMLIIEVLKGAVK